MLKQLLNTLYVQAQGAYVRLDHETLKLEVERELKLQVPLQHLGGMVLFGNVLVSPFLIHRFAEDGRSIAWFGTTGRFKARLAGPTTGNVLLRRAQYEAQADPWRTAARSRSQHRRGQGPKRPLRRPARRSRGHIPGPESIPLEKTARGLASVLKQLSGEPGVDGIRGLEGQAGRLYFENFAAMVRANKEAYAFNGRNRRPPRDRTNALLSFVYALVLGDCVAACEGVGLDPQFGYLHALRSGRPSLALDLQEELRPILADRLALSLINRSPAPARRLRRT